MDRKSAKEAFVSGLAGASKPEVFALVVTLSLSIVVCEHAKMARGARIAGPLLLEMLIIVYPQLLLCTGALPLWPTFYIYLLAAAASCLWSWVRAQRAAAAEGGTSLELGLRLEDLAGKRKSFISAFRGALMVATCTAILAVDFHAFPRRYAKAEAYGTGYMDVGVGGVVLAAGLVSSAASCSPETPWRPASLARRVYSGLRGALACWLLGLARLATTRAVDYQEHVGEYGVHWNFFDTIAVVALLGTAVAVPPGRLAAAALAVTAAHQAALSLGGLGPWVMSPHRQPDLLSLNKEGVVSAVGFYALFLWGAALAHAMHASLQPAVAAAAAEAAQQRRRRLLPARSTARSSPDARAAPGPSPSPGVSDGGGLAAGPLVWWWLRLVALDGLLWAAVAALEAHVEPVSRRSCNAAYIVWISAQLMAGVLPLALAQALATAAACTVTAAGTAGSDAAASGAAAAGAAASGAAASCTAVTAAAVAQRAGGSSGTEARVAGSGAAAGATDRSWGPLVLKAVNRNQLPVFLAANLLTGAVNLSMDTMQVPDWPAVALLAVYISAVCGVALLLDWRGWRLKL